MPIEPPNNADNSDKVFEELSPYARVDFVWVNLWVKFDRSKESEM